MFLETDTPVTRCGYATRIYRIDPTAPRPIHGATSGPKGWEVCSWFLDGSYELGYECGYDLMPIWREGEQYLTITRRIATITSILNPATILGLVSNKPVLWDRTGKDPYTGHHLLQLKTPTIHWDQLHVAIKEIEVVSEGILVNTCFCAVGTADQIFPNWREHIGQTFKRPEV